MLVQGCCEIREEGASRNRTATFGTMDNLGTMLKMLAGCPPVVLCVREYTAREASTPARHAYRIERLVALTAQWKQQPGYLEDLGSCVDELRTMLQSAADKPTTG